MILLSVFYFFNAVSLLPIIRCLQWRLLTRLLILLVFAEVFNILGVCSTVRSRREPFFGEPAVFDTTMPSTSSIRFHVLTQIYEDCGGCVVLDTIVTALKDLGYNVTAFDCPTIQPNESIVIIYPGGNHTRCATNSSNASIVHVRWMLAPLGMQTDPVTALRFFHPDDPVFHYCTNRQNSTLIPIPLTNILMLARNPYPGDDTDPDTLAKLPSFNRSGVIYCIRKGVKFHGPSLYSPDGKLPHEMLNISATLVNNLRVDQRTNELIRKAEYFLTYDPYSYWSMKAAMLGAVSVVHPVVGKTKEEWVDGFYIGAYLKSNGLPMNMPGVAYGWDEEELQYARRTMHEMRPLLLEVNRWGIEKSLSRMI